MPDHRVAGSQPRERPRPLQLPHRGPCWLRKRRSSMMRIGLMAVAVLAAALTLPGVAWAQASSYVVNYFNNAHTDAPDATYRIVNAKTNVPLSGIGDLLFLSQHGPRWGN